MECPGGIGGGWSWWTGHCPVARVIVGLGRRNNYIYEKADSLGEEMGISPGGGIKEYIPGGIKEDCPGGEWRRILPSSGKVRDEGTVNTEGRGGRKRQMRESGKAKGELNENRQKGAIPECI